LPKHLDPELSEMSSYVRRQAILAPLQRIDKRCFAVKTPLSSLLLFGSGTDARCTVALSQGDFTACFSKWCQVVAPTTSGCHSRPVPLSVPPVSESVSESFLRLSWFVMDWQNGPAE
jgi:hypothetical protein